MHFGIEIKESHIGMKKIQFYFELDILNFVDEYQLVQTASGKTGALLL